MAVATLEEHGSRPEGEKAARLILDGCGRAGKRQIEQPGGLGQVGRDQEDLRQQPFAEDRHRRVGDERIAARRDHHRVEHHVSLA